MRVSFWVIVRSGGVGGGLERVERLGTAVERVGTWVGRADRLMNADGRIILEAWLSRSIHC